MRFTFNNAVVDIMIAKYQYVRIKKKKQQLN
jgi:hypothetical protein